MPIVLAFLLYAGRLLTRPLDARLKWRQAGPFVLVAVAVGVAAMWVDLRPDGLTSNYFFGELLGVEAVATLSVSLVLATRARWLEPWFGGLDRMYLWHKRTGIFGTTALVSHVAVIGGGGGATSRLGQGLGVVGLLGLSGLVLVSLPQLGRLLHLSYRWWLIGHRTTGLFVLASVVHGVLLDEVVARSTPLMVVYLAIGTAGALAYGYSELAMRRRAPTWSYVVARVSRPSATVVELTLAPAAAAVPLRPGQFVLLRIGPDGRGREHPFTVAGTDQQGNLRLVVRAHGPGTTALHQTLEPGAPAQVTGPYGMFDYTLGGHRQIWVAGGIGITPFLAWLAELGPGGPYRVDLFYSVATEADALYLGEVRAAERRLAPAVRVHPVVTRTQGRLTAATITALIDLPPQTHVFLCGPDPMVTELSRDLRRIGVKRDHLHHESFSFR